MKSIDRFDKSIKGLDKLTTKSMPAFSKYETVLLFVSPYDGKLCHEKYQYFPLYKTTNDQWASPYSYVEYEHPLKKGFTVCPEPIPFVKEISFDVSNLTKKQIKDYYPDPFYKIIDHKAIAVYGNYIRELFLIKQQGILKARGIY